MVSNRIRIEGSGKRQTCPVRIVTSGPLRTGSPPEGLKMGQEKKPEHYDLSQLKGALKDE